METAETVLRPEDLKDAEEAWKLYKHTMRSHPRRQLRKRDLIAGYLAGVAAERVRQQKFVHPNIARAQSLIDLANLQPEIWALVKADNPELVNRLHDALGG